MKFRPLSITALLLLICVGVYSKLKFPKDTIDNALSNKNADISGKKSADSSASTKTKTTISSNDDDADEEDDDDDEEDIDDDDDDDDDNDDDDDDEAVTAEKSSKSDEDENDDENDDDDDDDKDDEEEDKEEKDVDNEDDDDDEDDEEEEDDEDEEEEEETSSSQQTSKNEDEEDDDEDDEDDEDEDDDDDDEDEEDEDEEEDGTEDEDEEEEDEDDDDDEEDDEEEDEEEKDVDNDDDDDDEDDEEDEEEDDDDEEEDELEVMEEDVSESMGYSSFSKTDSPHAVVFSWHVSARKNDHRWGSASIGNGNEFKVAVLSLKNSHPDLPVYVFTNAREIDPEIRQHVQIVNVDLMVEAGLDKILEEDGDNKIGFGTKAMSLIYGFENDILPDKVLYLDVDVIVLQRTEEFNLMRTFEPLEFYDFAAVFEGFAIGPRPTPAMGQGWEANTGVMSVRREALPLLKEWLQVFKERRKEFGEYLSGEQQAFMVALQHNPKYRIFPLPSVYNFRRPALWSATGPHLPVAVQTHLYSDPNLRVDQFSEVGKHSAVSMFEDSLHHMTMNGGPLHYVCDVMNG
eukprot:CAMPEP_0182419372 /NCGR_PEP_ID=MMETSP1167-20130531/3834_1 /TAXON_ID=2988 /ORGANISM="Mallomonas Sp, Strain CCMP3275" /LENGTH=572 /DNA_ID=CAMNT_0024594261 /DNA_START=114 /DNA_END=1832 /DNA_ORIENTATION=-